MMLLFYLEIPRALSRLVRVCLEVPGFEPMIYYIRIFNDRM